MDRIGSGAGEAAGGSNGSKRPFDQVDGDDDGLCFGDKRQRQAALGGVVIDAGVSESLQKLCSNWEPLIRRVVREEVEEAFRRLVAIGLGPRTLPRRIQESTESDLFLSFVCKISSCLYTGEKVEGEGGYPLQIVLKDESTQQIVNSGLLSSVKLEVVVLHGDFGNDDDDWTAEDFEKYVVKERDGKRPLLTGDLYVTLNGGVGTVGELTFTDNSSWIRSKKFKLGARVVPGSFKGMCIKECKTEAFTVKDHRGTLYKKHYPPHLKDDVWRLENIGKSGAFHKRLQEQNIRTVEDFLRLHSVDQQKLRSILGSGMSNKSWDATIEHAKTCNLEQKRYVYSAENVGVVLNIIYEPLGVISDNIVRPVASLNEREKVQVNKLVKAAYENPSSLIELDNGSLGNELRSNPQLGPLETQRSGSNDELLDILNQSINQSIVASVAPPIYNYPLDHALDCNNPINQIIPCHQVLHPAVDAQCQIAPGISFQTSFSINNVPAIAGVACGPSFMQPRSFSSFSNSLNPYVFLGNSNDWMSSSHILPNQFDCNGNKEDIHGQPVSLFGDLPFLHPQQEDFQVPREEAYLESVNPTTYSVRSSGKAYIGWLKIKAALQWGFFIRNIAAKKVGQRARLEELEG